MEDAAALGGAEILDAEGVVTDVVAAGADGLSIAAYASVEHEEKRVAAVEATFGSADSHTWCFAPE